MTEISIKNLKNLTKEETNLMNRIRIREGGKKEKKNFDKDYPAGTLFFFIKEKDKILSFGGLRPIKRSYLGKMYNILGICNVFSVKKGKGYGSILVKEILKYLKEKRKTGLGFTGATEFFKKAGLEIKKDFIRRFIYINPKTNKKIIDNEGDGIYYEGKDKLINKILLNKKLVYINIPHW